MMGSCRGVPPGMDAASNEPRAGRRHFGESVTTRSCGLRGGVMGPGGQRWPLQGRERRFYLRQTLETPEALVFVGLCAVSELTLLRKEMLLRVLPSVLHGSCLIGWIKL